MDAAVAVARTGFESGEWSALSPAQRKLVMLRWADLMQAHFEELAALDCVDAGKPITECLNTDMPATIETFRWYAEVVDKRSEEHTSELQSLMRISYAVFCLKKKNKNNRMHANKQQQILEY